MQGMFASGATALQPWSRPSIAMGESFNSVPFTVAELSQAIKNSEISASAVAETVIKRVEASSALEAIIAFDTEGLRKNAKAADRALLEARPLGPLHGVPIMLKDNIEAIGFTNTGGTPALHSYRPLRNAAVTQKLINAGAIIAGKANMDELAGGGSTNNPTFGRTRNPYNIKHIPGGSSGGSAAVVGGRIVPAALGTDTAGSIRTPAAYCGIAGFRPTQDSIPTSGIVPLAYSRDTCGPMATTVTDVALLHNVLTDNLAPVTAKSLKGVRLGLPAAVFQENLSAAVTNRLEEVIELLRDEGVIFVDEDIPNLAALVERTSLITLGGAFRMDMSQYLISREIDVTFDELAEQIANPFVRGWIEPFLNPQDDVRNDYADVMTNIIPALKRTYRDYLSEHRLEGIFFPTVPVTAGIEINIDGDLIIEGAEVPSGIWLNIQNTGPASLWGGPGLSIPAGLSTQGMPIGMELDGLIMEDRNVLALGLSIEAAMPLTPAPI